MKKNYRLLPFLLLTPLLLANSPAPDADTDSYSNFSVQISFKGIDNESNFRLYELNITNTGEYYADFDHFYINEIEIKNYNIVDGITFRYEALPPHTSKTITVQVHSHLENIANPVMTGWAYTYVDKGVTVSDIELKQYSSGVNIDYKLNNKGDYYYGAVVDFSYESTDYSVAFISEQFLSTLTFLDEEKTSEIDKVTIKKMTAIRSQHNTYKGIFGNPSGIFLGFVTALDYMCGAIIVGGGIILAIFFTGFTIFIVIDVTKRRKNKRKNID